MWRIDRLQLAMSKIFLRLNAALTYLETLLAGVKQPGRDAKHLSLFSETASNISMCDRRITGDPPFRSWGTRGCVPLYRPCSTHGEVRKTDCSTDTILTCRPLQTNKMMKKCVKITANQTENAALRNT